MYSLSLYTSITVINRTTGENAQNADKKAIKHCALDYCSLISGATFTFIVLKLNFISRNRRKPRVYFLHFN